MPKEFIVIGFYLRKLLELCFKFDDLVTVSGWSKNREISQNYSVVMTAPPPAILLHILRLLLLLADIYPT